MVACYEFDKDKRTHLIALQETGMNDDDFVTIFVGLRGQGFGTRNKATNETNYLDVDRITGTRAVWVQDPFEKPDGRNGDALLGAQNAYFLDFPSDNSTEFDGFMDMAMEEAQSWPFYCNECNYTSTFMPFLHDSVYMYALGLNRTLQADNSTDAIDKGDVIVANMVGTFLGASGTVTIGEGGYRMSSFAFGGLRADQRSYTFVTISITTEKTEVKLLYTDSANSIWELQGGQTPLDVPLCGFDGKSCPIDFWSSYGIYVIIAVVLVVVILIALILYRDVIVANMVGTFQGASGTVTIGAGGYRMSSFAFGGLRADQRSYTFVTISITTEKTEVKLLYTDSANSIWELQGGQTPLDVPLCGFDGKSCPIDFWSSYGIYVIIAVVLVVVILIALILYSLYYRRQQIQKLNHLWQINYVELKKPFKSKGSLSERSIQSKSSKNTLENLKESRNYLYFHYRQELVAAKKFESRKKFALHESDREGLRKLAQVNSTNLNKFVGLCLNGPIPLLIWKHCTRGSIWDIVENDSYKMDAFIAMSFMTDISNGLGYIHSDSFFNYHGRLTSKNCLVDDRWVVKLSDFGCNQIYKTETKITC
uniref:Protein kinase domain-containing protein n=1 Tax=Panagrolaimus sp. JU765 TaxID=591449 RepID=A0AC34QD27_9BILA